jgi:hypothetical protein
MFSTKFSRQMIKRNVFFETYFKDSNPFQRFIQKSLLTEPGPNSVKLFAPVIY